MNNFCDTRNSIASPKRSSRELTTPSLGHSCCLHLCQVTQKRAMHKGQNQQLWMQHLHQQRSSHLMVAKVPGTSERSQLESSSPLQRPWKSILEVLEKRVLLRRLERLFRKWHWYRLSMLSLFEDRLVHLIPMMMQQLGQFDFPLHCKCLPQFQSGNQSFRAEHSPRWACCSDTRSSFVGLGYCHCTTAACQLLPCGYAQIIFSFPWPQSSKGPERLPVAQQRRKGWSSLVQPQTVQCFLHSALEKCLFARIPGRREQLRLDY
mmetsp:Transcript_9928/g.23508  ORF Transcript_9928/g.23508 Transcript_9928/m.23508 type:complete len:263 (-) Transcript_9928:579-1367(-)